MPQKLASKLVCLLILPVLAVAGVYTLAAEPDAHQDWPQFRGQARDGVSPEKGLLATWPAEGPKLLWRRPVGSGFSAVAVADGRLFILHSEGEEELAGAFSTATGEELWRVPIGRKIHNEFGDGPRSTPTVAGDTVYALSSFGHLYALAAADGKKLWEVDFGDAFGSAPPMHGFSTSPLVEGDLVLVEVGGGAGEAYAAFDRKTGKLHWTAGDGVAGYNSPIAVTIDGVRQMIFSGADKVDAVLPDGRIAWSYNWPEQPIAMPIFVPPNQLFLSSAGGAGSLLLAVTAGEKGQKAAEVWKSPLMKNHFNSSVVHEGSVYGFDNTILKCVSLTTGEQLWAKRGLGKGSLILADGHLLILTDRGKVVQAAATPAEYREEGSFQAMSDKTWTSPTLADGKLYLRNHVEMVSLDLRG